MAKASKKATTARARTRDGMPRPSEHQIQRAVFEWMAHHYTTVGEVRARLVDFAFHVPNERASSLQRRILKGLGVVAGVSDIVIAIPRKPWHGLFVELKSERGTETVAQRRFRQRMLMAGYEAVIMRSVDETIAAIRPYLKGKPW